MIQSSPVFRDDPLSQGPISSSSLSLCFILLTTVAASLSMYLPLLYSLFHLWAITLKYRAPEKTASREDMIPQHILWVTLQEGEIKFFKSLRSNENGNKSQWNAVPGPSYKRGS